MPLDFIGPGWNASLNATAGVLIVLGYVAIKARAVTLHKVLMLAATGVSALFLASYLYYHFAVKRGISTPFVAPEGQEWVRTVYLAILLSHTILAVVVAPMVLVTVYLGLRDRLRGHVRLAWWTLPTWLYVSVTGVVVYWMLYRLYPSP